MNIRESAENYLEAILRIKNKKGRVRSIDIVNMLDFSKPSVSIAMKKLRENGYIAMDEEGYIELLPSGREIAERINERHDTLARLLMALGVEEKTAYEDACKIEHDLSQETFDCIRKHASTVLPE